MKKFSILMCAYNSAETIGEAIESCLVQDYEDWELLVLDNNSPDDSKRIIEEYEKKDSRIRYYYSAQNVGFAKGVSDLLEYTEGEYMCFLAADDYFVSKHAMSLVKQAVEENDVPSIVFVRHVLTNKDEERYIPREEYCNTLNLKSDNAMYMLSWLTKNWFFHSMFHFVNIEFVRKNGIDFFEPYYGDNEGMTEAVLRSGSVCCLDDCLYALTVNTSQTRHTVRMDPSLLHIRRYDSIKRYILESGYYVEFQVATAIHHVMMMYYDYLRGICGEAVTIDNYMNPVEASKYDRYKFTEAALSSRIWNEAELLSDDLEKEREKAFISIASYCYGMIEEGYEPFDDDWLMNIVLGGYEYSGGAAKKRSTYTAQDLEHLRTGLMSYENTYCYGFDLFYEMFDCFGESDSLEICRRYSSCRAELMDVYAEIKDAMKKNGRDMGAEYERLMKRCTEEIEEIGFFLSKDTLDSLKGRLISA